MNKFIISNLCFSVFLWSSGFSEGWGRSVRGTWADWDFIKTIKVTSLGWVKGREETVSVAANWRLTVWSCCSDQVFRFWLRWEFAGQDSEAVINLTRAVGLSRSATPRTVRLPTRVLIRLPFFSWLTGRAWPSDRWNSMSRWDRVYRDTQTGRDRWGTVRQHVIRSFSGTHLVVRQATIVRYKQRGLDRQVTETLHKLFPRLRHLRVVQDLLDVEMKHEF